MSSLCGRRVLSTRPAAQAQALITRLHALGATTVELPLFRIEAHGDAHAQAHQLAAARDAAAWIFTSANAATRAAALDPGPWPRLLAIGTATARALAALDHPGAETAAGGSTSEALLTHPALQAVRGQRLLLCTGVGGRGLIETELRARGAQIERLELYRRIPIAYSADEIAAALAGLDAIVCTSGESLDRLQQLTPEHARPALHTRVLVVPSPRVLELARQLGFRAVLAPAQTSDEALVACLEQGLAESAHHPT